MITLQDNLWSTAPHGTGFVRRKFPISGLVLYLPLWYPNGDVSIANGTGIANNLPSVLGVPAANTITVTQAGTFTIYLPTGLTGTASSGTATLTGSPVALTGGANTVTAEGTGTFTVTVTGILSKDLNAHVCTVTGATKGVTGRTFDGTDDVITIPAAASLRPTAAITIMLWSRRAAGSDDNPRLIHCLNAADNSGWELLRNATEAQGDPRVFQWNVGFSGTTRSPSTAAITTLNTWALIGLTYDGAMLQPFVNGAVSGTPLSQTGSITYPTTENVLIGSGESSANSLSGIVGEVWIYNVALSAAQMLQVYNNTRWRYS